MKISKKILLVVFFSLLFSLSFPSFIQSQDINFNQETEDMKQAIAEKKETQAKADKIQAEAIQAQKEVEVHRRAVEIEKKKALIEVKEARVSRHEAELTRKTGKTKKAVRAAMNRVKQEEHEVKIAKERIKIAEQKMLQAEEKASVFAEEAKLLQERVVIAEARIGSPQKMRYKKLIQTGFVVLIGYFLIFILVAIVNSRIKELKTRHILRKNVIYLLNFLIILYVVFIWLQNINSLTIFFSVLGAGVALALQEVLLCIAGWFLILVRQPFEVGDRVELGGVKGDVIDIRLIQTSLLEVGNWVDADQSTGRIVNVPNSAIYKKENYNYSRGFDFIWNEINLVVTFESDWKRGEKIMLKHGAKEVEGMEDVVKKKIKKMTKRYMIYYDKLTPIVYVNIKDSGVEITLRYLTEARKRRSTQDAICRAILDDFKKSDNINFAYTTYRIVK